MRPRLFRTVALGAVAGLLALVPATALTTATAAPARHHTPSTTTTTIPVAQVMTLAGNTNGEVRCPSGQETVLSTPLPIRVHCPGPSPTTTTTRPPTTLPPTTLPVTTTAPRPTTTVAPPPPGNTPAALMTDSLFNQNVTGWRVDSNSSATVANIIAQYEGAYGSVGVNFNRPVYEASASTPDVSVSVTSGCNNFTSSTGTEVPIPSYAVQGDSSDNILSVYDPSAGKAWEFWEAVKHSSTSWSACWGGETGLATSTGVFPSPYGETASGIANLATEVSEADVSSGSINHAIAMEVLGSHCDWSDTESDGGLYPADRTDCGYSVPNAPYEGSWFRFAPGTSMPGGLTPFAQMVFKAILTYGMVVVDQGGAVMLEADMNGYPGFNGPWELEGNSEATDPINNATGSVPEYQLVSSFPWKDLQLIDPPQASLGPPIGCQMGDNPSVKERPC